MYTNQKKKILKPNNGNDLQYRRATENKVYCNMVNKSGENLYNPPTFTQKVKEGDIYKNSKTPNKMIYITFEVEDDINIGITYNDIVNKSGKLIYKAN